MRHAQNNGGDGYGDCEYFNDSYKKSLMIADIDKYI